MKKSLQKKKLLLLLAISVVNIFGAEIFAQKIHDIETAKRVEQTNKLLKPVEDYVKQKEEFVKKEDKPHSVIADMADLNGDQAVWKRFASEAELNVSRVENESYTIANIWQKEGKTVAVKIMLSSPSGDWAQSVFYIFYPDGRLAKIDSTLNTFYGDATVVRTYWFDDEGKSLSRTVAYQDLKTRKTFDSKERDLLDREVDVYKNVKHLPFAKLLQTPEKLKSLNRNILPASKNN